MNRSHAGAPILSLAAWKGGAAFVLLTLVSGCAVVPGLNVKESDDSVGYHLVNVDSATIKALSPHAAPPADGTTAALESVPASDVITDNYRIGPGDILHVTVWDHPELTIPTGQNLGDLTAAGRVVSSDGLLFYPYVGEFKVGGMTVKQLREHLSTRLSRVITNPQVDARVVAFRSQRVQVSGEVKSPGLVTLDDTPKSLLDAVNERGGLNLTASHRRAYLTRGGKSYEVNLSGLLSGVNGGINPRLLAGDVITVPDQSSEQVFVLGEVERQLTVPLQQGSTTLTQVLTAAGGLDKLRANDSGLLIFRRPSSADEVPTVYRLDMDSPVGVLLAGEFELQARDVVYVKATGFAKYNSVINQFLPTISAIFQLDRLTSRR